MTAAYPLQWPEGFPRAKSREPGKFKTALPAALKNVQDSLRRFGEDSRDFAAGLGLAIPPLADLPRGGIVGRARLVDCVARHPSPWFFGRYGLVLAEVESIPFTPLKGALGLFDVPEGVLP